MILIYYRALRRSSGPDKFEVLMVPIHELLNRIRWDAEFARGEFELGYFDRVERRIIVVPFREIDFPQADPQTFRLMDTDGRTHRVPFHRAREVYKNGQRIWHRPEPETAKAKGTEVDSNVHAG